MATCEYPTCLRKQVSCGLTNAQRCSIKYSSTGKKNGKLKLGTQ